MSVEQARAFVARLESDPVFCQRMVEYIHREGYKCTLKEVSHAECELLMGCEHKHCKASSSVISNDRHCPYVAKPHGYEYWVG